MVYRAHDAPQNLGTLGDQMTSTEEGEREDGARNAFLMQVYQIIPICKSTLAAKVVGKERTMNRNPDLSRDTQYLYLTSL